MDKWFLCLAHVSPEKGATWDRLTNGLKRLGVEILVLRPQDIRAASISWTDDPSWVISVQGAEYHSADAIGIYLEEDLVMWSGSKELHDDDEDDTYYWNEIVAFLEAILGTARGLILNVPFDEYRSRTRRIGLLSSLLEVRFSDLRAVWSGYQEEGDPLQGETKTGEGGESRVRHSLLRVGARSHVVSDESSAADLISKRYGSVMQEMQKLLGVEILEVDIDITNGNLVGVTTYPDFGRYGDEVWDSILAIIDTRRSGQ